ncbi:DUF6714 family protein [Enterovibrio coralii]|uniref:Uncharacterized protein n=1 Tax=Enterovibrio coralii TaxID=294935 RepID=A0A135ICG4_9GAMM|nr:DUF6714 family protein [Enterovibrio coralii]KXF83034.1 hypothetical protein ATN88_04685 [Enterovibrio coralii]
MQQTENVIKQLKLAFGHRTKPHNQHLIVADVFDPEKEPLEALLIAKEPWDLTPDDIREVVSSNLWMLTPAAFHYYLPAFLAAMLNDKGNIGLFSDEMVDSLTRPNIEDADSKLEPIAGRDEVQFVRELRGFHHEWYSSGWPDTLFLQRYGTLTDDEKAAVLTCIEAFRERFGNDYPDDELGEVIARYWRAS